MTTARAEPTIPSSKLLPLIRTLPSGPRVTVIDRPSKMAYIRTPTTRISTAKYAPPLEAPWKDVANKVGYRTAMASIAIRKK